MRTLLASLAVLLTAAAAEPRLTKHQLEGGAAVILASLIDKQGLTSNGRHAAVLRCVIDGGRSCSRVNQASFEVKAGRVACEESHIAVGQFSCDVSLKSPRGKEETRHMSGHAAYELMSAVQRSGIPAEGAAGHEEIVAVGVRCSLDAKTLLERSGGGATCELFGVDEPEKPNAAPND